MRARQLGYRDDARKKLRLKTIEIIVETDPWQPASNRIAKNNTLNVRVQYGEVDLGREVKAAGGIWNRKKRSWELDYREVLRLGLMDRVIHE